MTGFTSLFCRRGERAEYAPTLSKPQSGFTLLEVLVSMAIMGMIMMLVWSTSSQTLNSKERIEKRDMIYQHGRVAFQKITSDLTMAFMTKKPGTSTAAATEGAAPILPPATSEIIMVPRPITFFIGNDEGNRDILRFTSMSHLRFFSGAKESDQCKVSYDIAASPDEPGVQNLVRTEIPWLDADTEVKGTPFVLAENVREFDLEYYDDRKDEWGKMWNTEQIDFMGRLPRAVRITLSFPDPDDEERSITMKTIVLLPMSAGPVDF
jgi:prepilin-type N-terminal cleavage/methylation domain-containing protein